MYYQIILILYIYIYDHVTVMHLYVYLYIFYISYIRWYSNNIGLRKRLKLGPLFVFLYLIIYAFMLKDMQINTKVKI